MGDQVRGVFFNLLLFKHKTMMVNQKESKVPRPYSLVLPVFLGSEMHIA